MRRTFEASNGHRLYEHQSLVYGFLRRQLGPEDAEDATVEVFRRVLRSRGGFRGQCSERAWVMRIAVNVAIRAKQERCKRNEVAIEDLGREEDWMPAMRNGAEEAAVQRHLVDVALRGLPEAQRDALWLRVGMEFTDEETAAILKVPTGTVKSWVWRTLSRLRKWAQDQEQAELEALRE